MKKKPNKGLFDEKTMHLYEILNFRKRMQPELARGAHG